MPFYQIGLSQKYACNYKRRLAYATSLTIQTKQFLILIYQDGHIELIADDSLSTPSRLVNKGKSIGQILSVHQQNALCLIQTFKTSYLLNLEQVNKSHEGLVEIPALQFEKCDDSEEYLKLTSKQVYLSSYKDMLHLKLCGRLNQELFYYYCQISDHKIVVKQYYRLKIANYFRVSLTSQEPSILIYQAYTNKFQPIKIKVLNYLPQIQKTMTLLRETQVIQFQQRCAVNNACLIGVDILGLVTNSHFQDMCQSNIILFNYHKNYTVNNIALKNMIINEVFLFGNRPFAQYHYNDIKLVFQCIGVSQQQKCLIQVFPLCSYNSQQTQIIQSDYHKVQQSSIMAYNEKQKLMSVYCKISKKAIYYSWLMQKSTGCESIFKAVIELLD